MSAADEQAVVHAVVNPCKLDALEPGEVEIDEFEFNYSMHEPPHIQNDVITINRSYAGDHQVSEVRRRHHSTLRVVLLCPCTKCQLLYWAT